MPAYPQHEVTVTVRVARSARVSPETLAQAMMRAAEDAVGRGPSSHPVENRGFTVKDIGGRR